MESLSVALDQKETRYKLTNKSQKIIVKMILHHTFLDLESFAEILEVNPLILSHVANGKEYFDRDTFKKLIDWLFIFLNG
ncbi:hypothetical protein FOLKNPGA_01757 [Legionella sp. PC1000]|uniref:hypothetical protein n=1 Tax=Legionella sp. PC1000 TaxID=2746060 RepID=UPI0015F9C2BC|nr:hypothetical protein [Legionella sp. PC1000]QLZ68977.1 hypothetical protein FOLKNPGA_01757 [Legionella sp. PC1000]